MKKIFVAVKKNIAIIRINKSVHPDWWFVSSDSTITNFMIIFSCSLWQEGFERGKCSSDTMGNHNKVTFYTEWWYLLNLLWNDCNLCLCTKYKSCNNYIINRIAEVSENDTSSNGDVKMLYVFLEIKTVVLNKQFLKLNN